MTKETVGIIRTFPTGTLIYGFDADQQKE